MSYVPIEWKDGDNRTPLSADNLNHMEDGVVNAISCDGDTMMGNLRLQNEPINDNEATTKGYIKKYVEEYAASFKDYTWRDYEFTIPAHSSKETIPKRENSFNGITFYTPEIEGKFSKCILKKITGSDFPNNPYFLKDNAQEDTGILLSINDFEDGEHRVYYLEGARLSWVYAFAVKRNGDNFMFTYKITDNGWRYSTSTAQLHFSVI